MDENLSSFAKGNWIVHCHYGIGQIKDVEKKRLDGQTNRFYKVQTEESTYWLAADQTDFERVRHLATNTEIRRAIDILNKPPQIIEDDHKERKAWIEKVSANYTITSVATLVRELNAWKKTRNLNSSDQKTLERNRMLLLQEWSLIEGISIGEAREKLQKILNKDVQ